MYVLGTYAIVDMYAIGTGDDNDDDNHTPLKFFQGNPLRGTLVNGIIFTLIRRNRGSWKYCWQKSNETKFLMNFCTKNTLFLSIMH
jgi:hypothetical protein